MSTPIDWGDPLDLWLDPWGSDFNTKLDKDLRLQRFADDFARMLRDVEAARWKLQCVDFAKLADDRMAVFRPLVEQLGRDVAGTVDDLNSALPEPKRESDAKRERLVDRLLDQAKGR